MTKTKRERILEIAQKNPEAKNNEIATRCDATVNYVSIVLSEALPKRKAERRKNSQGARVVRRILRNQNIDRAKLAELEGVDEAYAAVALYWTRLVVEQQA